MSAILVNQVVNESDSVLVSHRFPVEGALPGQSAQLILASAEVFVIGHFLVIDHI